MQRAVMMLAMVVVGMPVGVARADWTGELLFGGAWNADTTLKVQQDGQPDLDFAAEFSTRPFEQPLYWALRLGWEGERHGWAVDLNHHKLTLQNPVPEIQSFSLTHGYNLLTGQHAWLWPRWRCFALLGVVVAHPESTIRGEKKDEGTGLFNAGYELAGPVIGGGLSTTLRLGSSFEIVAEGRVTWSTVRVDVAGGTATLDNLAFHILLGPRLRLR